MEQILAKNEQILDGMERGVVSAKQAEQLGQCLKTPERLAKLEIAFLRMLQAYGRKAPVPRNALLRNAIGLPEAITPSDGQQVRKLAGEPDAK